MGIGRWETSKQTEQSRACWPWPCVTSGTYLRRRSSLLGVAVLNGGWRRRLKTVASRWRSLDQRRDRQTDKHVAPDYRAPRRANHRYYRTKSAVQYGRWSWRVAPAVAYRAQVPATVARGQSFTRQRVACRLRACRHGRAAGVTALLSRIGSPAALKQR